MLIRLFIMGLLFTFTIQPVHGATRMDSIDYILVEKSKRLLTTFANGQKIKTYPIALGFSPEGHKQQEGDGKTPEGMYHISWKNTQSKYYRSLKISYPNKQDRKHARMHNVSPGGDIMIHGLATGNRQLGQEHTNNDWTLGCIALTDRQMDEIFHQTKLGATIDIRP